MYRPGLTRSSWNESVAQFAAHLEETAEQVRNATAADVNDGA